LHATSVGPKSTRTRRESTPPATCARRDSTRPRPASTPSVTRASPESTRPLRVTVNIDCDNCVATQLSHARLTPADALDLLASQLSHAVAPASALYLPRSRSRWRRKWHPQQQRTCQPWWRLPSPLLATPAECPASELQWRRRTQRQLHSKPVFCCRQKGQCAPALLFCAFLCRPFCLPPQSPVGMRSPSMSKGLGFYTRLGQHHCVIRRIQKDCMAASKWSPTPPSDHDIFI